MPGPASRDIALTDNQRVKAKIDFSTYSLSQLQESANSIDREQFPERAREIDALIIEKQSALPDWNPNRYYYTRNFLNLASSMFVLLVIGIFFFWYVSRLFEVAQTPSPLEALFVVLCSGFGLYFSYRYARTYYRLQNKQRYIEFGDSTISLPVDSNSLDTVEIPIEDLHEVYYREDRRSSAILDLVVVYGRGHSAFIQRRYFTPDDFDAIAGRLAQLCNIDDIVYRPFN
jgi:hypothetical protein